MKRVRLDWAGLPGLGPTVLQSLPGLVLQLYCLGTACKEYPSYPMPWYHLHDVGTPRIIHLLVLVGTAMVLHAEPQYQSYQLLLSEVSAFTARLPYNAYRWVGWGVWGAPGGLDVAGVWGLSLLIAFCALSLALPCVSPLPCVSSRRVFPCFLPLPACHSAISPAGTYI